MLTYIDGQPHDLGDTARKVLRLLFLNEGFMVHSWELCNCAGCSMNTLYQAIHQLRKKFDIRSIRGGYVYGKEVRDGS